MTIIGPQDYTPIGWQGAAQHTWTPSCDGNHEPGPCPEAQPDRSDHMTTPWKYTTVRVTTGVGSDARQMITLNATAFTTDEKGYLDVWREHDVIARFAPGWTWVGFEPETKGIAP